MILWKGASLCDISLDGLSEYRTSIVYLFLGKDLVMKPISLRHLIIAKQSLPEDLCKDLVSNWGVSPKEAEYVALISLMSEFSKIDSPVEDHFFNLLDYCYFGFSIPQIAKEFDCLWIGEDLILNLELKSGAKPEIELQKQLLQNRYYLGTLGRSILSFTYVSSTNVSYKLDNEGKLRRTTINEIVEALIGIHQQTLFTGSIDSLFHPEDYLVSPFNSTGRFLRNEYFLTSQQEEIKKSVIAAINNPQGPAFLAITGGPGSGKTLLLYDIAKSLMQTGKKVVIGHAGGLNRGHEYLNMNGWEICPTKDLLPFRFDLMNKGASCVSLVEADVYLMDESQRSPDVERVALLVKKNRKRCIFAFDANQYLNKKEFQRNNKDKISALVGPKGLFCLTSNIRTNEAVREFILALFNNKRNNHKNFKDNVDFTYCTDIPQVQATLEMLRNRGYEVPKFTPNASDYHPRNNYEDWFPQVGLSAHEIIGQEFDTVVGLISPNMYYSEEGKLISHEDYYYIEDRMLYQILSRARRKIHLVIFNNQDVLTRCLELLKQN